MADFKQTDWYRFPFYYDVVFGPDTRKEADFLEAVMGRHGASSAQRVPARILEPACGTGRLVLELARRGHEVTGFDASREMLAYARERRREETPAVRRRARFVLDRMESFHSPRAHYDLAFCLLSTFKYLLTEQDARAHLRRITTALKPGGLYILGLHLTDYTRTRTDRELWRGTQNSVRVTCETITRPPDARTRLEWLRNRLQVRPSHGVTDALAAGQVHERLETQWQCRTYNAAELEALLAQVPRLEPVACYDFAHDVDSPRGLDDTQEDIVVVLRKQ